MRVIRHTLLLVAVAILAACGAAEPKWAPDAEVARSVYRDPTPPALTLYTVISNKSGAGLHSALMVNAPSQRAIFDPAGTFKHPHLPERNDVIFGMSDAAVDFYIDYHARITFRVVEQKIPVSPQVAELVLARIQAYGAVPKANCANSISDILKDVPGFSDAPQTYFPNRLMAWMSTKPITSSQTHYDNSPDDNDGMIYAPPLRLQ
ncbi:hypothetical protein [Celeribacter arenosi]|uniref:Lipoprotein n=1 Tax=Celeribacter arenosi TaxID=792649 RepID=A0ABP7K0P1_9RHOB